MPDVGSFRGAHQVRRRDVVALVVLDTLAPAERLAFVLHDSFAVPFEDIAGLLERSPAAVRQLASRARRRVQLADPERLGALDLSGLGS